MARQLGQKWVLLTPDDSDLDTPVVETSKGRMILVEVHQWMDTGEIFHTPVQLEFFQP